MGSESPTVLVVEDEPLIALDLQALLEGAGYRVLGPASSSAAALKLLEETEADIALLDVSLGRSDAFDVATELAARESRVIFLTGHTVHKLPQAHRHWPLVSKPYLPHAVLQAVRDALADRNSAREHAA